MIKQLHLVSYLSPNLFWFYQAVGAYLSRTLAVDVEVTEGRCDPLDDPLLQQDRLDLAFLCGLPLIRHSKLRPEQLQAIAAPVMQAERYQNRPIYFADVIVNAASPLLQFEQLAGHRFCFNDPGSNSGYYLMHHRLTQGKYPMPFFRQMLQTGSHQRSIAWIVEQQADCAAIDSVVLEQALRQFRRLPQVRVIESLGPNPMPPLAAAQRLGQPLLRQLQSALLQPDLELRWQMQQAGVRRFAAMQTGDYEAIAQQYNQVCRSQQVNIT